MVNIKTTVGQRIKQLRQKNKLTQESLADLAGIDYKYLQKIEGKNPPDMGIILVEKLAKALKTTPAKLLNSK